MAEQMCHIPLSSIVTIIEMDEHDDLPDRKAAAAALSRLSHALVRHRASAPVLRAIAREAQRLAAGIEQAQVRERRSELLSHPNFDAAAREDSLSELVDEDSAFVDTFCDSPVSGSANPLSIGVRLSRDGEESVGTVTLAPGWQGAPDRAHGGVVAAAIDEVLGALLPMLGIMAYTGELTVRYTGPCPLGVPLTFRARADRIDGRKLYLACEGTDPDGNVFATAHATFITVDLAHLRQS